MKTLREMMDLIESAQREGVAEAAKPIHPELHKKLTAGGYTHVKDNIYTHPRHGKVRVSPSGPDRLGRSKNGIKPEGVRIHGRGIEAFTNDWTNKSSKFGEGVAEGSLNEGQYEMMMRNGQVKKFIAKDDADAKRIAAGYGAKSVIKLKGGVPAGKVAEQGVAEGEKKPHPQTWHDVDPKLGRAVDKMSQAEKVKKGLAHPDTLKKKKSEQGVAEEQVEESTPDALAKIEDLFRK